MTVGLPAVSRNIALEIPRATTTYELFALRLILAFSGHVTGTAGFDIPHSLVDCTTNMIYDSMMASGVMASGYTNVSLQLDSENSAGMMFYYPIN